MAEPLGIIGTALGILNFAYWAWWSKRDKVIIIRHELCPEFLSNVSQERPPELLIEAQCELVLSRGDKELEVRNVKIMLDKRICEALKHYFFIPQANSLSLRYVNLYESDSQPHPIILTPKKSTLFKREVYLNCSKELEQKFAHTTEIPNVDIIQSLLNKLEINYTICWTRYDGKTLCWSFPDRWWKNLGKKLWG